MRILYRIQSSRIQDVKMDEGTTVRKLRDFCIAHGYDVDNARICVVRNGQPYLYGDILDYVLKPGEEVNFSTYSIDLPNLRSAAAKTATVGVECSGVIRSTCEATYSRSELGVDVVRNPDGSITVHIQQ